MRAFRQRAASNSGRSEEPAQSLEPANRPDVLERGDPALAVPGELVAGGKSGEIGSHLGVDPRSSADTPGVLGRGLVRQSSQAFVVFQLSEGAHVRGDNVVR